MKKTILFLILTVFVLLFVSCEENGDNSKICWECNQKKVWETNYGVPSVVTFKHEYCNKSEKDIQKIIKKYTYSGYEGGGNMNSTMTCHPKK